MPKQSYIPRGIGLSGDVREPDILSKSRGTAQERKQSQIDAVVADLAFRQLGPEMQARFERDLEVAVSGDETAAAAARVRLTRFGVLASWTVDEVAGLKDAIVGKRNAMALNRAHRGAEARSQRVSADFDSRMAAIQRGEDPDAAERRTGDLDALWRATQEGRGPSPVESASVADARRELDALFRKPGGSIGGAPAPAEEIPEHIGE